MRLPQVKHRNKTVPSRLFAADHFKRVTRSSFFLLGRLKRLRGNGLPTPRSTCLAPGDYLSQIFGG